MKTRYYITARKSRLVTLELSLLLVAALACDIVTVDSITTPSPTSIPSQAPAPTPAEVQWDIRPDVLSIRYWGPDRNPGPYAVTNLIPPLQVWGDGRIIWLSSGTVYYQRHLMEGYLSTEQMHEMLQHIARAGFFEWDASYTEASPLPAHILVVRLADQRAHSVYVASSHPPEGFLDLITFLLAVPATSGGARPYVPMTASVRASQILELAPDADAPEWPDAGYSLEEVGADTGMSIDGVTLAFAWELVNLSPGAPILVQSKGKGYFIEVAVPGVSLCTGQRDPAFDIRWSCR